MSIYSGPNTTQSGLILHIDPSNPRSYPGSGTTIFDISGNGNNGTLTNGASVVNQRSGRALDFANGTDYVAISNTPLTGTFSVSMWFSRRTIGGGDGNCLLGNTGSGGTLLPYVQASNYLIRTDGSASQSYALPTLVAINHVVVTRDQSNNVRVFTSGIESTSGAKSISGTFTINMIGRYQVQGYGLDGVMDDIRIYNRALSPQEIINNFNATRGRYGI